MLKYANLALLLILSVACVAGAQSIGLDRERGSTILNTIKRQIKSNYYDSNLRGIDLDERFKVAGERIKKATSNGEIFGIIAQALLDLDDSHTFFIPPPRASRTDYGWQMQVIGNKCYVTAVKPGSDADTKGLKPGDEIYSIDGFEPTRENLWKMEYAYYTLRPRAGMRVVIQLPDNKQRELDVLAKVTTGKKIINLSGDDDGSDIWALEREAENEDRLNRHRFFELSEELLIWKMPQFDLRDGDVDEIMGRARKHKALVLDLRGNGGGLVTTLQRLVGHFFEKDLKIADLKGRKPMKPFLAKGRGERAFTGKVVVLIDSRSGSAAELFARVMQLEKRGTVLGDRSSGAVMRSRLYPHEIGQDTIVPFAVSITDADVIMSDGNSLERSGVVPDELLLPRGDDLKSKRDPVLSRAVFLAGAKLDPEKAGALFPVEWRK